MTDSGQHHTSAKRTPIFWLPVLYAPALLLTWALIDDNNAGMVLMFAPWLALVPIGVCALVAWAREERFPLGHLVLAFLAFVIVVGVGIARESYSASKNAAEEMGSISLSGLNHMPDASVTSFSVEGQWGGHAGAGGSVTCCVPLPHPWHAGLTMKVNWERHDILSDKTSLHEARVAIPEYSEAGRLWVHFLPGDKVEIYASMLSPGHPDYPGPKVPAYGLGKEPVRVKQIQQEEAASREHAVSAR